MNRKQLEKNLPDGWKLIKFKNFTEFKNGLNFNESNYRKGIKIIGVQNFRDHFTISYNNLTEINLDKEIEDTYYLKNNDLLFVRSNGNKALIGRVLFIENLYEKISHSGFTIRARINNDALFPKYCAYYFNSYFVKKQFLKFGGGTNINSLSQDILGSVIILLPPPNEQKKISDILTTWDNAIDKTESLINAKTNLKRGLMQKLLTGKVRFKEFEGQKWEMVKLKDVGNIVTGSTPPKNDLDNYGGDIPWVTAVDMTNKYIYDTKLKITEKGKKYLRIVPKNSILITCIASIGKNAIAKVNLATNQQINTITVNNKFYNEFIYYLITYSTKKLISLAGKTAVPILNKSEFELIFLSMPGTIKEQQKIASVLSTIDKEIDLLNNKLNKLKQQKKGLMQKLLTGKVRVKV